MMRLVRNAPDNPEVPASSASKVIKKYEQLHPEGIHQKSEIIVETFRSARAAFIGFGKCVPNKRIVIFSKMTLLATLLFYIEEKSHTAPAHNEIATEIYLDL